MSSYSPQPPAATSAEETSSLPIHRQRRLQEPPRVVVIGAGPVGLEAALYASRLGCKVWVFEREAAVGADIRAWAHVGMFTPWSLNRSPLGELALREQANVLRADAPRLPGGSLYPTGGDFLSLYLEPLARLLGESVLLETRVVSVGRSYLFPEDSEDQPHQRKARRFRLLTRSPREERIFTADYVLDTSGLSHTPNRLGAGGVPALGEMGGAQHIFYHIPDIKGRDRIHFLGKKTLLIGAGPSAATSALALAEVVDMNPPGSFVWVTKSRAELPFPYILDDPLPRRDLLFKKANLLVKQGHPHMEYLPITQVEAVQYQLAHQQFNVTLQVNHETRRMQFDSVIANVGSRLQTETFERSLQAGEPGFFTLGAKAASQADPACLLQDSRMQIRDVFRQIAKDSALDLYAKARQSLEAAS